MTLKIPLRPVLALLLSLGTSVVAHGATLADRLERPSQPSTLAALGLLTDIQTVGDHAVMVGAEGHILLRDNNGQVKQAAVPVDLLLTGVQFVDALNGWAVGHDGVVLHSSDGGSVWHKQLDGTVINPLVLKAAEDEVQRLQQALSAAPDDEQLSAALDNAQFSLEDAQAASAAGPSRPLLGVWFRNARQGWVVGAYGICLTTNDGGATWRVLNGLDNPERLHLNSVLGLADGSLLVAGEGGRLYRSIDDGEHWQATQQPTDASLYTLAERADGQVLAAGFGGTLLSSNDHGVSWTPRKLPVNVNLYGIEPLKNGGVMLAGAGGVLLYSTDGQSFAPWRAASKAAVLNINQSASGQWLLVGGNGLQVLAQSPFQEHAK